MVLKIIVYLIEPFKMKSLSTARSFESPKRNNLTFKWLGKFLKDELRRTSLSSTSRLQLHKEFKVSRKPWLNLCSFKWLKRRRNLVKYLIPSGSLTLNMDHLLGLIKERSLLFKTTIDSEFCFSGASCDHSDREFGKKEYLKQSVLQLKKRSVSCVYHKTFH